MSFPFFSLLSTYRKLWFVISVGFVAILIGMAMLADEITTEVGHLKSISQQLYLHPFKVHSAAREARLATAHIRINTLEAISISATSTRDDLLEKSRIHNDRIYAALDLIEHDFLGDLSKVKEAKSIALEWEIKRGKMYELIGRRRMEDAIHYLRNEVTPLYWALNERLAYIENFSSNKAANLADEAEFEAEQSTNKFIYLIAALIVFTLASGGITLTVVLHQLNRRDNQVALDQERIAHMANYDELTDLPNRALFNDRLKQAISVAKRNRNRNQLTVMFLDLDGFKNINDTQGHLTGDLLLKQVADRLSRCVRESDTVGRIGGDEFAVIVNDAETIKQVAALAEKLIETINSPFDLEGSEVHIGISIGISSYSDETATQDDLINNADMAMYESKKKGKNRYTFYSQTPDLSAEEWIRFDLFQHIGIHDLDEQHHGLTRTLNRVNSAVLSNQPKKEILDLFDELIMATASHFETEERYMIHYDYPERNGHIKEHDQLVNDAKKMRVELSSSEDKLNLHSIRDWLLNHIQYSDKPLAEYLMRQGVS